MIFISSGQINNESNGKRRNVITGVTGKMKDKTEFTIGPSKIIGQQFSIEKY